MTHFEQPWPQENEPRKSRKALWITLTVLGALLLCAVGGFVLFGAGVAGVSNEIKRQEVDRVQHVKLDSCTRTSIADLIEAEYTITNSSETAQSYVVQIDIMDAKGVRVGEATGFNNDVQAGQTAKGTAMGSLTGSTGRVACAVRSA